MLSEMTSSELADWQRYFTHTPFSHRLLDAEFAALSSTMVSLVAGECGLNAEDFSLLARSGTDNVMTDEMLMTVAESMGGERHVPADR
jgi:phage tail assembly protein T